MDSDETPSGFSAVPLDIPARAQPAATENKMNHWFQTSVICSTVWAACGSYIGITLSIIWGVFAVVIWRDEQKWQAQNKVTKPGSRLLHG